MTFIQVLFFYIFSWIHAALCMPLYIPTYQESHDWLSKHDSSHELVSASASCRKALLALALNTIQNILSFTLTVSGFPWTSRCTRYTEDKEFHNLLFVTHTIVKQILLAVVCRWSFHYHYKNFVLPKILRMVAGN